MSSSRDSLQRSSSGPGSLQTPARGHACYRTLRGWHCLFLQIAQQTALSPSPLWRRWVCSSCKRPRSSRQSPPACRGPDGRAVLGWALLASQGARAPHTRCMAQPAGGLGPLLHRHGKAGERAPERGSPAALLHGQGLPLVTGQCWGGHGDPERTSPSKTDSEGLWPTEPKPKR